MTDTNPARSRTLSRFRELLDHAPNVAENEAGGASRRRSSLQLAQPGRARSGLTCA